MDNLSPNAKQVLDALAEIGQGTVAEIRERTGRTNRVTDKAVKELADAALVGQTDPGDGTPARWSITAPAADPTGPDVALDTQPDASTTQDEAVNPAGGDPAGTDTSDLGQLDQMDTTGAPTTDAVEDTTVEDTTVEAASADNPATPTQQVPTRAKPPADRKVLAVAGVLGDYPHGATIDEIAEACGFNVGVVVRLLQAMEHGDAARRVPPDTEAGTPQRWQPGPGKASEVDPNPAPPRCPTCHQVMRTSTPRTTTTPRGGGSGTVNSDGNEPLGRGVLRAWVEQFVNAHPGHQLTPGTIAEALGAQHGRTLSSGAVLNNCRTLAMNEQIQVVRSEPFTVTANPPAAAGTTASDSEQQ